MRRRVLAGLAVLAAVVVGGPGGLDAQGKRWGKNYFPDAAVVTQDGETLQFYDDPPTGHGGDVQEHRIAPLGRPTAWQRRSPSHGRSGLIGHGLQGLVITAEGRSLI